MDTIGFIGSGNMAEAMINGILKANVYRPGKVYVSDIRTERTDYMREHKRLCQGRRPCGLHRSGDKSR